MLKLAFLMMSLVSAATNAEVFKCIDKSGKTLYQANPCKAASKEQQLNINSDPTKEADAKAKLEAVQSEYDDRKTAREKADKELSAERREAAKLEIANRNAIAQQEQAEAQKRQAEALENQNRNNNGPVFILPPPHPHSPMPVPLPKPRKTDTVAE